MKGSWIGVDLDGTLAEYDKWRGPYHIGNPIDAMYKRVLKWVHNGQQVRIFTARVSGNRPDSRIARRAIQKWCRIWFGFELPITNRKDFGMIELWDDRAVQVIKNTGKRADGR